MLPQMPPATLRARAFPCARLRGPLSAQVLPVRSAITRQMEGSLAGIIDTQTDAGRGLTRRNGSSSTQKASDCTDPLCRFAQGPGTSYPEPAHFQ